MRKKIRNIEVDGNLFVWRVKPSYKSMEIKIWNSDKKLIYARSMYKDPEYTTSHHVTTPSKIADIIRALIYIKPYITQ